MAIDPTTTTTVKVSELASAGYNTTDLIPHEVAGILKKGNLQDLATFIGSIIDVEGSVGFRAVNVTDGQTLPATTEEEFILVGPGTFPNVGGGSAITTTEPLNALVSNGTYWFIGVEIPIAASGAWGSIEGNIETQTDLQDALDLKADLVDGKVPASQLPSYVDDVVEVANYAALPSTGETGKIYITIDTNKVYRWSGSAYIEIAENNAVWGLIEGTLSSQTDLNTALGLKVPYTGATGNVDLGSHKLTASDLVVNHASGSGAAATISKGGNGEALTVTKSSGSGNAASILGGVTLLDELHLNTDLADAYIASAATWNAKQSALTFSSPLVNTSGTISIPASSGSVNGYLSSTDWTTFNTKQTALNGTGFVKISGTTISYDNTTYLSGTVAIANGGTGATTAGAARTNLGATTVGANIFTIPNPNPVTKAYIRANADNTVEWLDGNAFRESIGAGTGNGTVTSVNGTGSYGGLTLTGTVTGSGDLTLGGTPEGTWPISVSGNAASVNTVQVSTNADHYITFADANNGSPTAEFLYTIGTIKVNPSTGALTAGSFVKSGGTSSEFLMADGSVSTGSGGTVTGTGTSGQIAYWNGTSSITGSNNFTFSNDRLTINRTSDSRIFLQEGGVNIAQLQANSGNVNLSNNSTGTLSLSTNGAERLKTFANGNVLIQSGGTFTDNGFRLDVNGTARVQGALTVTADSTINGVGIGLGGGLIITNTRIGANALAANTTGANNTAYGRNSLLSNTTGSDNTVIGNGAFQNNTTGSSNTIIGKSSLPNNVLGSGNIAFGFEAGRYVAAGTNNTETNNSIYIGNGTRANAITQTNQIVIGHNAVGLGSNSTRIGNSSTTFTVIEGDLVLGSTTDNATDKLQVTGSANITGQLKLGSTITNGTFTYTLPGATGTLALVGGAGVGTVTSVAAITLGTTGTDLSSTVANGTTTPVITLNVPTASATNRGALSAADWTTFNSKQNALTNPVTGTGTSGHVAFWNGTSSITGESNLFWDSTNDRLGIGTASPNGSLSIVAPASSTAISLFGRSSDNYSALRFESNTGATRYATIYTNAADLIFETTAERMRITSGGNVLIGTTTDAGYKLDVNGNVRATGFFNSSDNRLKDLIDYDYNVSDIKPITYLWKDGRDNKKHVGYSAQEVQKVMPDAVNEDEKGFLSVNYVEVLVAQVELLNNRMAEMQKEIELLKSK